MEKNIIKIYNNKNTICVEILLDFNEIKNKIDFNKYYLVYKNKNNGFDENNFSKVFELEMKEKSYFINSFEIINKEHKTNNQYNQQIINKPFKLFEDKDYQNNNQNIISDCSYLNEDKKKIDNIESEIEEKIKKKNLLEKKIEEDIMTTELLTEENEKWLNRINENVIKVAEIEEAKAKLNDIKAEYSSLQEKYNTDKTKLSTEINNLENNINEKKKELSELKEILIKKQNAFETEKKQKNHELEEKIRKNSTILQHQLNIKEVQNNELKMKKKIEELKNGIGNNVKLYLDNLEEKFLEKIKIVSNHNFNLYIKNLEDLEKMRNDEFLEKKNDLEKLKIELLKMNELNNYKHFNIKCKKCGKNPIKGLLYKCSICKDYYLCDKCEQINYLENTHPHYFLKIRTISKKNKIFDSPKNKVEEEQPPDNKLNIEHVYSLTIKRKLNFNDKFNLYSIEYDFENTKNLNQNDLEKKIDSKNFYSCKIEQKTKFINQNNYNNQIKLIIENNGENKWIINKTFLKIQKNKYFDCEEIILSPLSIKESEEVNLLLKKKCNLETGKYTLLFDFFVEDKKYGEYEIIINI